MAVLLLWWLRGASLLIALLFSAVALTAGQVGWWGLSFLTQRDPWVDLEYQMVAIDDWVITPELGAGWGTGIALAASALAGGVLWLGWSIRPDRS